MKNLYVRPYYLFLRFCAVSLLAACGGGSGPVDAGIHLAVSTPLKAVAGSEFQVK